MVDEPVAKAPAFVVCGVNHNRVSVERREQLVAEVGDIASACKEVINRRLADEAAVIATCNRFEWFASGEEAESLAADLQHRFRIREQDLYQYRDLEAVRHIYRVASSLDSMVVGETQILGQVKQAYRDACAAGTVGPVLHHVFQSAFHIAKMVRSYTDVGQHGLSVSYIAVELAERIFGDLSSKSVLIVGAGETAELTLLNLRARGCRRFVVANRTVERAVELSGRFGGSAIALDAISSTLADVDVVIGSITSPKPIVDLDMVGKLKRRQPIFFIDLGVPRNFSANLGDLDSVYLYNLDDLQEVARKNQELRDAAARDAEIVIEYGVSRYREWQRKLADEPRAIELRRLVEDICMRETRHIISADRPPSADIIQQLSHRISQKLSHSLLEFMRQGADEDELAGRVLLVQPPEGEAALVTSKKSNHVL